MSSFNIGVILMLSNIYLSQAIKRDTNFNLKQSFVETNKEGALASFYIYCTTTCSSVKECCGFEFDKDTTMCLLLKHCSYGTATPRGMSYFKDTENGEVCTRDNVALKKPCGESSVYSNDPTYACDKANDGSLSSMMHTKTGKGNNGTHNFGESYPFWWVDLLSSRSVKEVVIYNRQGKFFFRLHNVNVTVGDDLADMEQCGYHDGPAPNTDTLTIKCEGNIKGRYLQIMNMDASDVENYLNIREVEVYDCWP